MPDLPQIRVTANGLLYVGSFLHLGVRGATFTTAPAELKGNACCGSAKELLKDGPFGGAHHSACPKHQQDQLDTRKSEVIVKAMNIGPAPYFLAVFVAIGRSHMLLEQE